MKKEYVAPTMVCEEFVANEYIAACGASGVVYNFSCDAGGGDLGEVWLETNGVAGLQKEAEYVWRGHKKVKVYDADISLGGYYACGATHEAESDSGFRAGYYQEYGSRKIVDVIVWRGTRNDNVHCTEELDMTKWETAKS